MGADDTLKAIEKLVKGRGEKAQRLWRIVKVPGIATTPDRLLEHFKVIAPMVAREYQEEAKSIIKDIENLLKNPPIP